MGILSKFENRMEDGIEGAAGVFGHTKLSPVQITKMAEKQMRRERIVGSGKQYAPTLYTVLVSRDDDRKLSSYYPTLSGEIETYLSARAREMGYVMDGHPLVRFLSDPELKRGKVDVVAEMVTSSIIERLRDDEMERYGITDRPRAKSSRGAAPKDRYKRNVQQPNMQPLVNLHAAQQDDFLQGADDADIPMETIEPSFADNGQPRGFNKYPSKDPFDDEPSMLHSGSREIGRAERMENDNFQSIRLREVVRQAKEIENDFDDAGKSAEPFITLHPDDAAVVLDLKPDKPSANDLQKHSGADALFGDLGIEEGEEFDDSDAPTIDIASGSPHDPNKLPDVYLYDEMRDTAYQLSGYPQKIGRESSNDIVVPDINISRQHAEIRQERSGAWVIEDLGSTNGMYINGIKVKQAPLRDADMITIGTTKLEFQLLG